MDYNELKEIAIKFNKYYVKTKYKLNEKPLVFDKWYEKSVLLDKANTEEKINNIIVFLNSTCQEYGKRGFLITGKKIRSLIRHKINQGFNEHDFYNVIKVKSIWLADKNMHKYFRPMTIFGNKFEDYLNESTKPLTETKDEQFSQAINRAANDTY